MAQIPKGRLVKGPYKAICRDCAIYFSITVSVSVFFFAYLAKLLGAYFELQGSLKLQDVHRSDHGSKLWLQHGMIPKPNKMDRGLSDNLHKDHKVMFFWSLDRIIGKNGPSIWQFSF